MKRRNKEKLHYKRLRLYMEATEYEVNVIKEYEKYKRTYEAKEIFDKVISNKNSYLNKNILRLEEIIEEMKPDICGDDEMMKPLLRTQAILNKLLILKCELRGYVLDDENYIDVFFK